MPRKTLSFRDCLPQELVSMSGKSNSEIFTALLLPTDVLLSLVEFESAKSSRVATDDTKELPLLLKITTSR